MLKKLTDTWKLLNRSIYTGERLRDNLLALTIVSYFCAGMGLVLLVVNLFSRDTAMLVASAATLLASLVCVYCAKVLRDRELAALIPTLFCIVAFTVYAVKGYGEGTAMLWALMAPLGLCYFVSVRNGIIVSAYYSVFFLILFYTPLRASMEQYYSESFMVRFPILYIAMAGFTAISMIQYHRGILLENEYTDKLNKEVAKQTAVAEARSFRIEQMSLQSIETLAHAIDAKDPYTRGHSTRVSQYSVLLAQALGWSNERVSDLHYSAMLHDIGKIGVPDSILNSPKRLTDVEYNIIKAHTNMGGDILHNRIMIKSAEDVARSHHERYDGKGYPRGLKGQEISEEARIVAIADAFDAMSSNRVYRNACNAEHISRELENGKGKQFDPEYAELFLVLWRRGQFDSILKSGFIEEDERVAESSALLRKAAEDFASGGAAEFEGPEAFVSDLKERSPGGFCSITVSLDAPDGAFVSAEELDTAMYYMDQAIRQTLRRVDVAVRYGERQFLLLLPGADPRELKRTAGRIFIAFYKMHGGCTLLPSWAAVSQEALPAPAGKA